MKTATWLTYVYSLYFLAGTHFSQAQSGTKDWFPLQTQDDFSRGVIDAGNWLDAPAGKHGFVQVNKDRMQFEDGTPVKFWGVNIASGWVYTGNTEAHHWAQYLAKYGVNSVRFHKFSEDGLSDASSTLIIPEKMARLDYFSGELKKKGIYYGWSHIYGHKPRPGDRSRLLAYEEVLNAGDAHLKGSTIGLVNFAPDLQQLSIELTVNMLNHRNPYTGLRYADDPALSFIELQNEDNIFFATTLNWVQACPTYKQLFCRQFSEWLKNKYGNQQNLVQAWGQAGIDAFPKYQRGEHLDKQNILPIAHHGYLSKKTLQNKQLQARLYDTALFLYETQNAFYTRYINAIRATGYKGPIVASCWQAGDDIGHYYNLHSDALAGIIDRHNYFGGSGKHQLAPGPFNNTAMVSAPGSGLFSTGLQQVASRPFALSEWMSMVPNEWTAESAPLLAVYGMGLQGWDASYAYASNVPGLTSTLQSPRHGVYNADSPVHISLYPALARMIYRNDVKEGAIVSTRKVHVPSLAKGRIGFEETINQSGDVKSFGGHTPQEALAAGRCVVAFTDTFEKSILPELNTYWDKTKQHIRSTTGQLNWHYGKYDFFTVNSPGTKAFVGFSDNRPYRLGEWTIQVHNPFGIVFITSLQKDTPPRQAKHFLVTTIARARNTEMEYAGDSAALKSIGKAPILMEPVKVTLKYTSAGNPVVYVLDHSGKRTSAQVPMTKSAIVLDGSLYKTMYYEVVLP